MSPSTERILAKVGETFIPPERPGDWHGGDHTSRALALHMYHGGPWYTRVAMWGGLWLIDFSVLLLLGKFARFTSLDAGDRLLCLQRFSRRFPFAFAFAPLRAWLAFAIYSRPDVQRTIGYHNQGRDHGKDHGRGAR